MCCPQCESQDHGFKDYGWTPARRIYTFNGSYFIFSIRYPSVINFFTLSLMDLFITSYQCLGCKYTFRASSAQIRAQMPFYAQHQFPAYLTKRAGVDTDILFHLRAGVTHGAGPSTICDLIRQQTTRQHHLHELEYYSLIESIMFHQGTSRQTTLTPAFKLTPSNIPRFSTFENKLGYKGQYPSGIYDVNS